MKYKHLEDDSNISGIGSLFRGVDRKNWSINLNFFDKSNSSLNFSAVPILARRRVMNPTKSKGKKGKPFKFLITNAQKWQVASLKDCPAFYKAPKGQDASQLCFIAEVKGRRIFIPQLEMARVLFYHDPFMARLSLQHNALNEDFYVKHREKQSEIHVLGEAEYPLYYFNRVDNRRFLSWVLMDEHARKSFETISTNLFTQKYRKGSYDHWDFQFTPPPLEGVELSVSGWDDYESKSFFVWEIKSLSDLPSSFSGEVNIIHPKYDRNVGGRPVSGRGSLPEAPDQYELDDQELSSVDKATIQLISDTTAINFKTPFITNRISKNMRTANGIIGDGEKEVLDNSLSANEKEDTGSLPGGTWNNLDDQTDDAHLYLSKFQSFLDMVGVLEAMHGCKIIDQTAVKLPKQGNGKKHWLANTQNSRCLAALELLFNGKSIILLEVDTSDGAAKLSTMMLVTGGEGWVMKNLGTIAQGIMRRSLSWPSALFQKELGKDGYRGITHPQSKHSGSIAPEEIAPWAKRFANKLSQ
ncbi:MAG: hypothetical protein JKX82_16050 [Oleispira sp.]|nr:hypothetical protein [Oleispira sp.]